MFKYGKSGLIIHFLLSLFLVALLTTQTKALVSVLGTPTFVTLANTHSFTVPAGSNRILLVVISDDEGTDILTANFGTTAMTQRSEHTDGFAVDSIWSLNLGTSASSTTETISATTNGTGDLAFIAAIAFSNVDQTNPVNNAQNADNSIFPSASTLNVTSASSNLVFDVFNSARVVSPITMITQGAGQTIQHNSGGIQFPNTSWGHYQTSIKTGETSTAMNWTTDIGQFMIHNAVNINAAPTAAGVIIEGRVSTADGRGILNAIVTLTDSGGNSRQVQTGSFGYYQFDDVEVGNTYILQVSNKRFTFINPTQVVTVLGQITNADFIAETDNISPRNNLIINKKN